MLIFLPKVFWCASVESLMILCCAGWFFAGLWEAVLWPVRAGDVSAGFVEFIEARAINAQLEAFGKNRVCFACIKENGTNAVQQCALLNT